MTIRPFIPEELPAAPRQLIEASAGTGKTYSITSLYLRFILERELRVDQILVLSFTEAATAELHARLRARLQAAVAAYQGLGTGQDAFLAGLVSASRRPGRDLLLLQRALAEIDQAAVTTIHSFCHRILQQGAFESGMPFELELVSAVDEFVDELIYDFLAAISHRDDSRLLALLRRRYGLEQLRRLVGEAVRHRYFPVVSPGPGAAPGAAATQESAEAWAATRAAYRRARQSWRENEAAIGAELEEADLLKKCRDLLAGGLVAQLAAYLREDEPRSLVVPLGAEKLIPAAFRDPEGGVCKKAAIKKGQIPQHPFFACWQEYLEQVTGLDAAYRAASLAALVAFARRELPRRLYAAGVQSFDDLLYNLEQALRQRGWESLRSFIASRYPVALIDEFQDTDPVQYAIFQSVYRPREPEAATGSSPGGDQRRLILIGDPKQAIYGFRGADIFAYLQAAADCGDQRYTMTVNWRADRGMVAAVNALFSGLSAPFVVPGIDFPRVEARPDAGDLWRARPECGSAPLQFLHLPPETVAAALSCARGRQPARSKVEQMVPALVAADIVRLLRGGGELADRPLRPADIAVLVRSNRQAGQIQEALQRLGVKAVLHSRASVFQSSEAAQLSILLHGLLEQAGDARRRAALITDLLACRPADLPALEADEKTWQSWMAAFNRWGLWWRERGFMAMMRAISEERGVAVRLLAQPDGDRRLTNFRHLVELLHGRERQEHLQPPALLQSLDESITGRRPETEVDELRLESDEEAVQVLTIHRSKGLEYPVVYCPYLWRTYQRQDEARNPGADFFAYHDPADNWAGKIALLPVDRQRDQRRREEFAEELRLLYVALTRARHCCRVVWAGASGYEDSALAYLLHGLDQDGPGWLGGLTHEDLLELLRQRVAPESEWGLSSLPAAGQITPLAPATELGAGLPVRARRLEARIDSAWRVGSFSQLAARSAEFYDPGAGRDYDSAGPDPGLAAGGPATAATFAPLMEARIPLAAFPAGGGAGNLFHRILETASFTDASRHPEIIAEQSRIFGFNRPEWQPLLQQALAAVLTTPLTSPQDTGQPFCLADIDDRHRLNEMAFTFPVRQQRTPLEAGRLAAVFARFPEGLPAAYDEQIKALRFPALQGYLKGFVDLICLWRGKWYVIDYKSNLLGPTFGAYQPRHLAPVMSSHHYVLQYHIYQVALHRHLAARLPDYDYERHCGGALYLFLRGLNPELGPAAGVFYERPPRARIEALDELLAAAAPGGEKGP